MGTRPTGKVGSVEQRTHLRPAGCQHLATPWSQAPPRVREATACRKKHGKGDPREQMNIRHWRGGGWVHPHHPKRAKVSEDRKGEQGWRGCAQLASHIANTGAPKHHVLPYPVLNLI